MCKLADKGKLGEKKFKDWLNKQNMSFLYINQSPDLHPSLFKNNIKKPDYFVLLESIGMIAVDVKNMDTFYDYQIEKDCLTLTIDEELKRALAFERLFKMSLWYAYFNEDKDTWYWISALKAIEVGILRHNKIDKKDFLAIEIKHFLVMKSNDDLGKLYTQRYNSYSRIASLLNT